MSGDHPGSSPVAAVEHIALARKGAWDATRLVQVYIVLLFAMPSYVTISGMGALGRPHFLWGLVMFAFWALSRLQWRTVDVASVSQPIRFAFTTLFVIALVGFAAATLRGQPTDQVSQLITSVLRLLSWAGVLLVIIDGVRTMRDVARIIRFAAVGASLLAALALAQAFTGQSFLDFWGSIPGVDVGEGGLAERAGRIRSAATATHPLEFGTILNAALPLCIACAFTRGFGSGRTRSAAGWWAASALLAAVALISVSRSSIIGLAVAVILMLPAVPRQARLPVLLVGGAGAAVMVALMPGLVGTTLGLFLNSDGSTLSRTGALDRLPEFVSASPLIGIGFGLFLPRYYVLDNGWAGLAIEVGILGVLAFGALIVTAVWSAWRASRLSVSENVRVGGHALAASVITVGVLFAFFDGLSFPMSGGFLFVLIGLCGAVRTVSAAEASDVGVVISTDAFEETPEGRRQSRTAARSLRPKRATSS